MEMKDQIGKFYGRPYFKHNRLFCRKSEEPGSFRKKTSFGSSKRECIYRRKDSCRGKGNKTVEAEQWIQNLETPRYITLAKHGSQQWILSICGSSPYDIVHYFSSTPPQLPYHHHRPPTYTIRPVPEHALTLTIKIAPGSKSINFMNLSNTPDTYAAFTTARHVSIAFRTVTSKRHVSIGSSRWSNVMASVLNAWQSN